MKLLIIDLEKFEDIIKRGKDVAFVRVFSFLEDEFNEASRILDTDSSIEERAKQYHNKVMFRSDVLPFHYYMDGATDQKISSNSS